MLLLVDWDSVTILQNSEVACNRVLEIFSGLYDIAFPKQNIKIRDKTLKRSWKSKSFKAVPKEKKHYTKRLCKKKQNQCRKIHNL